MSHDTPLLHMICGKIAAGKSTLAKELAKADHTILISEDTWLHALFGDQMAGLQDYVRCAARLRTVLGPHVAQLLQAGSCVVLDFPANTVETRAWMRGILDQSGADHCLHLLAPPDDVCIARMHARTATGDHPFALSEAQFHRVSKHFVPPQPEEGFKILRHDAR
ncbi:hypothetical protein NIT7321_00059 [Phaeobacter italicus]|jgi:predicted kinase|uniref:Kinase n=1 Tax=Phaeobacter italicus TaxID=481446 RepID=A0A0H5DCL8_9RHOB|nr:ATP-binding protein [Phaeobacter italicus]CRL09230.1 hypothetical protein NIT7321_00059 [Phaeobacter italicus]